MCGIAGIINFREREDHIALLKGMIGLMEHRGPDSAGIFTNGGSASIGHARLSIIDISGGDQPIHNEDRTLWIVFNGEVFNYIELRKELKIKGHRFYTNTDTEVLVHLYEEFGPEMLSKLNGQFAFAIWNKRDDSLFMARDRVGIRPFFYSYSASRLIFASEIKAIFADKNQSRELDPKTLSDIFTCWSPILESSSFKGIYQLPPGHYAVFRKAGLSIKKYWVPNFDNTSHGLRTIDSWVEELKSLVLDATRIRLRADVPVGAYLSGGIDSTFTTSLVKENFNNSLRTFSVRFSNGRFDETRYQKIALDRLKTDHSDIICSDQDIGQIFPKIVWHTETPILRTAPAPLFMLSKLVRENNYKVVLTGEGADEIFAGYNIFKEDRIRRFWSKHPESRLRPLLLKTLYPYIFKQSNGKAKNYLEGFFKKNLTDTTSLIYSHLLRWHNTYRLRGFFSKDVQQECDDLDVFTKKYIGSLPDNFENWDSLAQAQYTEITIFLSNYLLSSQGDRMAMANSVEGRYPFLDHRIIEFATTLPPNLKMNGLNEKYLLKIAAEPSIPREIIARPKQPYRAPVSSCFLSESKPDYVNEILSRHSIMKSNIFDYNRVKRLLKKGNQGKGVLLSERENMALVGIVSTLLLDQQYVRNFPKIHDIELKNINIVS